MLQVILLPVRVPTNRPRSARVLKYIPRSYLPPERCNEKESNMYIGGGMLLLLIVLFLFFR